jgi:hypothetical protein
MISTTRTLLVAACLPVLLAGCSGSSADKATETPSAAASHPSASPTGPLPVATSYLVTAGKGVSDDDLKRALTDIAKLPGVRAASLVGQHRLRVDLAFAQPEPQRQAILAAMRT